MIIHVQLWRVHLNITCIWHIMLGPIQGHRGSVCKSRHSTPWSIVLNISFLSSLNNVLQILACICIVHAIKHVMSGLVQSLHRRCRYMSIILLTTCTNIQMGIRYQALTICSSSKNKTVTDLHSYCKFRPQRHKGYLEHSQRNREPVFWNREPVFWSIYTLKMT